MIEANFELAENAHGDYFVQSLSTAKKVLYWVNLKFLACICGLVCRRFEQRMAFRQLFKHDESVINININGNTQYIYAFKIIYIIFIPVTK